MVCGQRECVLARLETEILIGTALCDRLYRTIASFILDARLFSPYIDCPHIMVRR